MSNTDKAAMRQALDALIEYDYAKTDKADSLGFEAINALREAIAQPAAVGAVEQDAARYRWLRNHENGNCVVNGELLSGENLDREVDALLPPKPLRANKC